MSTADDGRELTPNERTWVDLLLVTFAEFTDAQLRNELPTGLGAICLDWDYADDGEQVRVEMLAFDYQEEGSAEARFLSYVPPERALGRDHYAVGPAIESQRSFERIVAAAADSTAFADLDALRPFYFTWQEHDVGHCFFAVAEHRNR